jgi:hypothetical protein
VLDVRESLFLRGGDDPAIGDKASGGIMEGGVDTQSVHHYS